MDRVVSRGIFTTLYEEQRQRFRMPSIQHASNRFPSLK